MDARSSHIARIVSSAGAALCLLVTSGPAAAQPAAPASPAPPVAPVAPVGSTDVPPAGETTIEPAVPAPITEPPAKDQQTPAANPLTLFGDVRFRFDTDVRSGTGTDDANDARTRPRLRLRFGAKYKLAVKGVSLGFRFATNAGTPGNSPHRTFGADTGAGAGANSIDLDRAYIRYAPRKGAHVAVGKLGWPHWQQTEVFWDEDIQPEGLVGAYTHELGKNGKLTATGGYFFLNNNGWTKRPFRNDILGTWQLNWSGKFGKLAPTIAVTGVHIRDTGPVENTDGTYNFNDTNFVLASAQVKAALPQAKITAGIDVGMSDADADGAAPNHTGSFVAQLRASKGAFGVRYYFYLVEEAAAPFWGESALSQDNFPNSRGGGLAGFTGHRMQLDWSVGKGLAADFRVYLQEGRSGNALAFSETPGRSIKRFQLNVNAKF